MALRLTEAEYTALVRRAQPGPPVLAEAVFQIGAQPKPAEISEEAFQRAVIAFAKQHQWLCYFTKNSRNSPSGYPDLTLAKAGQPLYVCELKREGGQVTKAQAAWLEALRGCTGIISEVWRPKDLEEICRTLRQ